jgi:hemimethylated DNA binding protein
VVLFFLMAVARNAVVPALYRSLLRSARRLESAARARGLSARGEARRFERSPGAARAGREEEEATPTEAVRGEFFGQVRHWSDLEDVQERISLGFRALRQAHDRLEQLASPQWEPRDPSVAFYVGQVVRHRKYNYRGVVVGFDAQCQAPDTWRKRMGVDKLKRRHRQPFYHLLVDRRDDPRRYRTYCAEENIADEVEHWEAGGVGEGPGGSGGGKEPLEHPEILDFFSSWSDGRYCLGEDLRRDYPED